MINVNLPGAALCAPPSSPPSSPPSRSCSEPYASYEGTPPGSPSVPWRRVSYPVMYPRATKASKSGVRRAWAGARGF